MPEAIEESRADVEMENDEDGEPLKAEIPRVRMNPRIAREERSRNTKILDMLFTGVGELLVSKVEVLGDSIELN